MLQELMIEKPGKKSGCRFYLQQSCEGCPNQADCKIKQFMEAKELELVDDHYKIVS